MPQQTQSARLHELLTFFGCPHDIAPPDARLFAQRTGELISRAANDGWSTRVASHSRTEPRHATRSLQRRRRGKRYSTSRPQ
jgi:hypothetical protein